MCCCTVHLVGEFESGCNQRIHALFLELCEVTEVDAVDAEVPIQYQCLECLALFDTPELWFAHRQTHNRSSTHSSLSNDTVSTHTHTHTHTNTHARLGIHDDSDLLSICFD